MLTESEAGAKKDDVYRRLRISSATFYSWLKLPRRKSLPAQAPEWLTQRWSLDFISDGLADFKNSRIQNVVEDYSGFYPDKIVHVAISGAQIARFHNDLALRVGLTEEIVIDNRP